MDLKSSIELKVDYMDMERGYIYHIQDYFHTKKLGLPTAGIIVTCGNEKVGLIEESEINKILGKAE